MSCRQQEGAVVFAFAAARLLRSLRSASCMLTCLVCHSTIVLQASVLLSV